MTTILGILGTTLDLLLVILGFSFIIFVHELGHFLAARWAGIRVLAFAIGFGPPIVSYRAGIGLRRQSSEREYLSRLRARGLSPESASASAGGGSVDGVSPTEYRLNWVPFGGYVKMLGQEDLDPGAVSGAADSYQNCPPWKRMVVISAGVVMNVITAALLFVVVFMVGLRTEPAKIGDVVPGLPASRAVASNAEALGVNEPGLKAGDEVVAIDGVRPNSFNDLVLAAAMSGPGDSVTFSVKRAGVSEPLEFVLTPETSPTTRLKEIGVGPARSGMIFNAANEAQRESMRQGLAAMGLAGVEPGMRIVAAGTASDVRPAETAHDLEAAVARSGGEPVVVRFAGSDGATTDVTITPNAELQTDLLGASSDRLALVQHIAGLTPVMRVASVAETDRGYELGLRTGDVFARVGTAEFPSVVRGVREIRAHAGKEVPLIVLRRSGDAVEEIRMVAPVSREGRIGFGVGDTAEDSTLLALPETELTPLGAGAKPYRPAASGVITRPGSRIAQVAGTDVATFEQLREALRRATAQAATAGAAASVELTLELPLAGRPLQTVALALSAEMVRDLHRLSWSTPIAGAFELEETMLKAATPMAAVSMGAAETRRVMVMTYLTFARLFQGTVHVEHLKGPVGIAHLGTTIADRGFIWLLFFMALISVNLAVINFLPMPIVDGGQFVFLLIEQIRGRPVPIAVQNLATIAGLMLIGTIFLITTFNDIANLFGV